MNTAQTSLGPWVRGLAAAVIIAVSLGAPVSATHLAAGADAASDMDLMLLLHTDAAQGALPRRAPGRLFPCCQ